MIQIMQNSILKAFVAYKFHIYHRLIKLQLILQSAGTKRNGWTNLQPKS